MLKLIDNTERLTLALLIHKGPFLLLLSLSTHLPLSLLSFLLSITFFLPPFLSLFIFPSLCLPPSLSLSRSNGFDGERLSIKGMFTLHLCVCVRGCVRVCVCYMRTWWGPASSESDGLFVKSSQISLSSLYFSLSPSFSLLSLYFSISLSLSLSLYLSLSLPPLLLSLSLSLCLSPLSFLFFSLPLSLPLFLSLSPSSSPLSLSISPLSLSLSPPL